MENSPSWEANSCSATHSNPCLLQNMWVHYHFNQSLTHTLSPNFFSPPVFCSHIYSPLNNITIMAHMFSALQTSCWHAKMRDKKKWDTENNGKSNLTYQSYRGTINFQRNSNLKTRQTYPKIHTLISNQTKNLVDDDKHNHQAKRPLWNWQNQKPNIITVEMLIVLLQWLCSEVWEGEFSDPWQQWICLRVCRLVYIEAPKSGVEFSLWLWISITMCSSLMSHSLYMTKPISFHLSSIILILSFGRYSF